MLLTALMTSLELRLGLHVGVLPCELGADDEKNHGKTIESTPELGISIYQTIAGTVFIGTGWLQHSYG